MFRSNSWRGVSVGLLGCALVVSACGGSPSEGGDLPSGGESVEQTGTLNLPLRVTVGDHVYRFGYFQAYVYPVGQFLTSTDAPTETMLSTSLATGQYQVSLFNWSLQRDDGEGNFVPVIANLVSSSYVGFEILNGSSTTVSFQFETDGQIITVGSGNLNVAAKISERAPVCVPLSADCGEGLWCPPPELTGAALACRSVGTLELGAACNGPADCVANASCVDFGEGPVCAALCSRAEFESACPGGGVCSAAGRDYGVCTPAAVE